MIYYGVNPYHFWCGVATTLILEYLAFMVCYVVLKIKVRRMKKKLEKLEQERRAEDESL